MRRFAMAAALFVAVNGVLAAIPVVMHVLNENLYVAVMMLLAVEFALYAGVLVIIRVRRSRGIREVQR